jgi:deoxyribodipyrimidine photolyase-related protein
MRGVYEFEGDSLRKANELKHDRKLPKSFYSGVGIPPVDAVIGRVRKYAYCHHIERLMVLGNFMLLCEFRPKDVYRWFMELFIDAYDWVMVPNVFAMSQYAKGGVVTTKPYVSSSNYIRKMSDFPKGDWCDVWDSLFWRFIRKHRKRLKKNPRMALLVSQLDSRPEGPAEEFLDSL